MTNLEVLQFIHIKGNILILDSLFAYPNLNCRVKYSSTNLIFSLFSMVFWVNMATPVRIESARMDGSVRKTIVQNNLQNPSDLTVDVTTDKLYWSDKDLRKIETSDLYGKNRKVLVSEKDAFGLVNIPVAIAVLGDFLYIEIA